MHSADGSAFIVLVGGVPGVFPKACSRRKSNGPGKGKRCSLESRHWTTCSSTVSASDDSSRTPLGAACEGGHIDVVKFLMERDREKRAAREIIGTTPLHMQWRIQGRGGSGGAKERPFSAASLVLQHPAAHARALSNLTQPTSACLNFEPCSHT